MYITNTIQFGKYMRQRRKELHLTQIELANKVDCTNRSIGSIERGQQNLTIETMLSICTAIDLVIEIKPLNNTI